MRKIFFQELYKQMQKDENIWVVTGDLGYIGFDKIRDDFPSRFVNAGASEQAMMGIAVGLAIKGKKPFVYSITPFLLRRPYETIKLYLHNEKIPVRLVGSGRDFDYAHDGPSHDATDTKRLLDTVPNVIQYFPQTDEAVIEYVGKMVNYKEPSFISLRRA